MRGLDSLAMHRWQPSAPASAIPEKIITGPNLSEEVIRYNLYLTVHGGQNPVTGNGAYKSLARTLLN
jgi:hypothetical protein